MPLDVTAANETVAMVLNISRRLGLSWQEVHKGQKRYGFTACTGRTNFTRRQP